MKPGSVLTIKGEYLNLILEVIFPNEVIVPKANFKFQNRKEIQVVVPEEAQTVNSLFLILPLKIKKLSPTGYIQMY